LFFEKRGVLAAKVRFFSDIEANLPEKESIPVTDIKLMLSFAILNSHYYVIWAYAPVAIAASSTSIDSNLFLIIIEECINYWNIVSLYYLLVSVCHLARFRVQSYKKSSAEQKIIIFFMPRRSKFAISDGKVTKKNQKKAFWENIN